VPKRLDLLDHALAHHDAAMVEGDCKVFMKLGISSRSELIRHGVREGVEQEEAATALS
jgi:metal-responsive CopG/Arc/MetJ family transcriptional regulator